MDDDQQFCLRWNNHQSTLVSVFDNLLENGTLVDCTLFAEGKSLKAHKVVLSACSPYFESLLTQEYDKHPIFILKDVKFQELKAMMDYMYRGEVNISQDQLSALLRAAESLQIKGLSDSRGKGEGETRKTVQPPQPRSPPPAPQPSIPRVQGLTIEQRKSSKLSAASDALEDSRSREGSTSPMPRKRKKPRRRPSQDGVNDNHDASNSSESHSNQAAPIVGAGQNIPSLNSSSSSPATSTTAAATAVPLASTSKLLTDVPEPIESKSDIIAGRQSKTASTSDTSSVSQVQVPMKEKIETHSELMLEPKSEYIEEDMNEDSVEDLTLDDDDVSQMEHEMDQARPGPSHGATDGTQGFGSWHMGNQSQDEVFLAAQEAVGAHRDSQGKNQYPYSLRL